VSVDFSIISIGTLSQNSLWNEQSPVRTAHATTTLVTDGDKRILVDPSLPGNMLEARFFERTGKGLDTVTDVFCTTLRPVHRRGIEALTNARWWTSQVELETYSGHLETMLESAERLSGDDVDSVRADLKQLGSFAPAPEKFSPQIEFYPLYGASPGSAGLLLTPPASTIIIAGDAIVTGEHLKAGRLWKGVSDMEAAADTLRDLVELAGIVIPGHDNVTFLGQRWL